MKTFARILLLAVSLGALVMPTMTQDFSEAGPDGPEAAQPGKPTVSQDEGSTADETQAASPPEPDGTVPENYREIEQACGFTGRSLSAEGTDEQLRCVVELVRIRDARRWRRLNLPDAARFDSGVLRPSPLAVAPAGPSCPLLSPGAREHLQTGPPKQCLAARATLRARVNCESNQRKKLQGRLKQILDHPLSKRDLALERDFNSKCAGKPKDQAPKECQALFNELKRVDARWEAMFGKEVRSLVASLQSVEKALAEDSKLLAQAKCGQNCPPCKPYKAGTIGYIGPHTNHDHHPVGRPHLHLYKVNQNSKTCRCFWNKNSPGAVAPPAHRSWVNLNAGFPQLTP